MQSNFCIPANQYLHKKLDNKRSLLGLDIIIKRFELGMDLIHLTSLTQTVKEPVLKEFGPDALGVLRVDWGVRGFWEFQREALFDIRIINADASFDSTLSLE